MARPVVLANKRHGKKLAAVAVIEGLGSLRFPQEHS